MSSLSCRKWQSKFCWRCFQKLRLMTINFQNVVFEKFPWHNAERHTECFCEYLRDSWCFGRRWVWAPYEKPWNDTPLSDRILGLVGVVVWIFCVECMHDIQSLSIMIHENKPPVCLLSMISDLVKSCLENCNVIDNLLTEGSY